MVINRRLRRALRPACLVCLVMALLAALPGFLVFADQCFPPGKFPFEPPGIEFAPIALLMEHRTGTVLFEHDSDRSHVPASLTKIVTVYTALEASRDGGFLLDEPGPVDPRAHAAAMPGGSSLMFLGPGQRVDGWDLLRGLAVSSGNDAAVEVALRVSGSVSSFAGAMNAAVRELGFSGMYFEEPAGLSPGNRITAREMARFTSLMIDRWPESLPRLFSREDFTYPEARHFSNSIMNGTPIRQSNRNALLTTYAGTDGMKTGFTSAAGYNLVATAERAGERLIAVLLGVDAPNHFEGNRRRSSDAVSLLDWGFENFRTIKPVVPELDRITVRAGRDHSVVLRADAPVWLTIPAAAVSSLRGEIHVPEELWAPIEEGEAVGVIRYVSDECVVLELPIRVAEPVDRGRLLWRLWERWRWWLAGIAQRITERFTAS